MYLPRGRWTNLETNELFPGRQTITVETDSLPVFARNGAIVPLDSPAGMALHYFPSLGAEFFVLESDIGEWTQIHAAPAAEVIRLQVQSAKERAYEWVVHHVDRPPAVGFEGRLFPEMKTPVELPPDTWYYDATTRNLQVRIQVGASEDRVVNVGPEP